MRLDAADAAFTSLDVEKFSGSMDDAALTVGCLEELVTPSLAGRYHRMVGLDLFVSRDESGAERAFAASRAVDPTGVLGPDLVAEGHEVRAVFGQFDLSAGRWDTLPPPASGQIVLDGTAGLERALGWPVLVQIVDPVGAVTQSAYLFPGDPMLEYAIDPAFLRREARRKRTRLALFGTAVGTAVASGFVYGLAAASAGSFEEDHPDWTLDDLEKQQARTNALVGVSGGLAVVAIGTGTAGLLLKAPR